MLLLLLACGDVSITKVETDNDHDGYNVEVDCDDAHQTVNPDAEEICDGLDNNCDGEVDNDVSEAPAWYVDSDGDGYGDPTVSESACDAPAGFVAENTDCLDQEEAAFPGNPEICDGIDNDCNDAVDDDPSDVVLVYGDADGDGYGSGPAISTCAPTGGQSLVDGDCNDGNTAVHPSAPETDCTDPTDYNCDGSVAYADADADGSPACEDCNDANPDQHPGALEICNSLDDDCDQLIDDADPSLSGASTFYRDLDGDGYAGTGPSTTACSAPLGYSASTGDCDDGDAAVHPGATEVCDPADLDEDCNGSADDADAGTAPSTWSTWYRDSDGDSYGDSGRSITSCDPTSSLYISVDGDCDDLDATVHPGALESCNAVDDDCDSLVDDDDPDTVGLATWYRDADTDSYGDPARSGQACSQPSGYVANATDCNDASAAVNPAATEICDSQDNDCDGQTDEGLYQTWYRDADTDNYGTSSSTTSACAQPSGYVANATDCNDASAAVNPAATEICDSQDNDCDGQTDEGLFQTWYRDADTDNYGTSSSTTSACAQPSGYVANATDCNDASAAVNPAATEICDSLDNDCDGTTDEGCGSRILSGDFLSSDYDTKIYGDSLNDYFGSSVAGGDFNGNGLADIAVGSPDDEYSTNTNLGVVYLYNGALASGVQLCTDQDAALWYSNSSSSYPDFGEFMWTLPDYSGDGLPELAVGSNQNFYNRIAVFTAGSYSGAQSIATRTTSFSCSDISGSGNFSSTVGNGVACGYVSSGTDPGVVYIYGYGSGTPVTTLTAEAGAKLTGYGLDVEQDIDGDGVNDAVVGAPQANAGGSAYVVMGPVNGTYNLANYDLKIQGPSSAGSIAERVLVAELDGDGRMDIVISDHNYNYGSRSGAGAFRVVTSLPSGILSWDQADTSIYGSAQADGLGYLPASAGDVDGDGNGDLLVSSHGNGGNGAASGVVWLLYGPLTAATVDLATDYDARWFGESTYTYLGTASIIAGDTNGDGFDDIVLNSLFGDQGSATDRGAVWLFLGG